MGNLSGLEILDMTLRDTAQVEVITRDLNLSHWSRLDYENEISREFSVAKIGKLNKRIIGFLIARLIILHNSANNKPKYNYKETTKETKYNEFDTNKINIDVEIEIYNIGVVEQLQKKGIGLKLFDALLNVSSKYRSAKIWLEVRESNAKAINFYKSNGFEVFYLRKNFYTHPQEDGIVMKLEINNAHPQNNKPSELAT